MADVFVGDKPTVTPASVDMAVILQGGAVKKATIATIVQAGVDAGAVPGQITALQAADTALDGRLDTAEGEIDALQAADTALQGADTALDGRLDTAEGTLVSHGTRITTAEGDIDALQAADVALDGRLDAAEPAITALQGADTALDGRLDTAEGTITSHGTRITTAEGEIDALQAATVAATIAATVFGQESTLPVETTAADIAHIRVTDTLNAAEKATPLLVATAQIAATATTAPAGGDLFLGASSGLPRKWTAAQTAGVVYGEANSLGTGTALAKVIGVTGAGAAAGRANADLVTDLLGTAGVPAAIGVGATIQVGTVPRTLESKEYELISVKDYGAVGDGVMSDSAAFQAAADNCDVNFSTYVFVPNYDETYLITTPVVFQYPDIRIFGFKGAGYQRGTTGDLRRGNILIGSGAAHAIDLGASRTTAPTGQWNVANIGIQQAAGVAVRTKNGIALTSKHDGPHRGAVFKEVSAIGLNAAIYIPDPEVSTSLCNLIIENCCLSNNNYSLLCEGNVLGLRFVGNQAEQNAFGAIHGNFSCGIYIADNMLEGQPNPIYLKAYAPVGNRPKVAIERNYFEGVSGNYVIKIESGTPDADIIIRNNYSDNNSASDYVRISNPGPYYIEMYDSFPVTHTSLVTFAYGSKFLEKFPYFQIRLKDDIAIQWWHSIKEYSNLVDNAALNTHVIFSSGTQEYTPYGYKYIRYNADLIDIPLSGVVGDLIAINVLCSIGAGGLIKPKLFNESDQDVAISEYSQYMKANGRWSLVTIGLRIQTNGATTMKFQLFEATSTVILGVAARNYGATTINEEATKIDIYPVIPNIP